MALKPSTFVLFHGYILLAYLITFLAKSNSINGFGLIFTLLIMAPLFWLISKGLPIDCLSYEIAVRREIESKNN